MNKTLVAELAVIEHLANLTGKAKEQYQVEYEAAARLAALDTEETNEQ